MSFVIPSAEGHKADEERFRLYVRRGNAKRAQCVATSPDAGGVGVALVTLAAENEFDADDHVGVMDTFAGGDQLAVAGTWLVNPYARPIR